MYKRLKGESVKTTLQYSLYCHVATYTLVIFVHQHKLIQFHTFLVANITFMKHNQLAQCNAMQMTYALELLKVT